MEALVLGVKRYSFVNDDGEKVEGAKIAYLDDLEGTFFQTNDLKGIFPLTVSAPVGAFDHFSKLPAFYDLDFRQRPDSKGKPVMVLVGAKFVSEISFEKV
ncbi:MAG: hypothetical protein N2645_06875 [Clostridia bacterium]|nr:hypothetical protein [Clostridia bacterium]